MLVRQTNFFVRYIIMLIVVQTPCPGLANMIMRQWINNSPENSSIFIQNKPYDMPAAENDLSLSREFSVVDAEQAKEHLLMCTIAYQLGRKANSWLFNKIAWHIE